MTVVLAVDVSDVEPDVETELVSEDVSVIDALEDTVVVALALWLDVAVDVSVVEGEVISQLRNSALPRWTKSFKTETNSLHRVSSEPGISKMRAAENPAEHPRL